MMASSTLHAIVIDCTDLDVSARFWSEVFGVGIKGGSEPYKWLDTVIPGLTIILQRVPEAKTGKSPVHIDLAATDVEAEVSRLEGLGARRQRFVEQWWVMQDPSGNEFCVVPAD